MLENKEATFSKGKIIAFRISTGEEIIGEITDFDSHSVSIKKPCASMYDQQTGNVGLVPASILSEPETSVVYQRSAIIATMLPRSDAEATYKSYISKIIAPAANDRLVVPNSAK